MTDSFSLQSATQTHTDTPAPKKTGQGRKMESVPFQVGKGKDASWSMRRRVAGQDFFLSGFSSRSAVKQAMKELVDEARKGNRQVGRGAHMTCVAQALQDYARERLPFLKGAPQEARRINVYLRAAGLVLLKVVPLAPGNDFASTPGRSGRGAFFRIDLEAHTLERKIPNGLHAHRRALASTNASSDRLRAVLAGTCVADVSRHQLQQLMDRMTQDGASAATVGLERALLRRMFNHAFASWSWSQLMDNPATKLRMPMVDNERDRVLSHQEQALLDEALTSCRNELVAPTLTLLRETAMRASEPLDHATWADVDWEGCIIRLGDSKSGKRDVPLSPTAMEALEQLKARGRALPGDPVVSITYESLRAAWRRACERAGIEDLNIHDLRHTAATRMALHSGNIFLVQALTGHKDINSVKRYVNVRAEDVVRVMHEGARTAIEAGQHKGASGAPGGKKPSRIPARPRQEGNVTHVNFRRAA